MRPGNCLVFVSLDGLCETGNGTAESTLSPADVYFQEKKPGFQQELQARPDAFGWEGTAFTGISR